MTHQTIAVDATGEARLPAQTARTAGSILTVEVRPQLGRLHTLAGDVMAALGKRRDISGKGRNEHDDIRHARAWMHAHSTTDLLLTHTERVHPRALQAVASLPTGTGIERLWLLHEPPRSDAFVHALERRCRYRATIADLPGAGEDHPGTPPEGEQPPADPMPEVPRVEFTTFWSACQEHLTAAELDAVGELLSTTIESCQRRFIRDGATEDAVAALVFGLLNDAPDDSELAIEIRALQLAAWHNDLYVKVDHTRLLHHEERPRTSCDRVDEAMRAYRQPYRALTVALARRGFGMEDLATIRVRDADAGGDGSAAVNVLGDAVTLTAAAGVALRAQLYLLSTAGATGDDLLLPHTPKALAKVLTDAHVDLGLHIHGRRAERTRNHTTRALRQLGIMVHRLP